VRRQRNARNREPLDKETHNNRDKKKTDAELKKTRDWDSMIPPSLRPNPVVVRMCAALDHGA
jgi:hypothetical protein